MLPAACLSNGRRRGPGDSVAQRHVLCAVVRRSRRSAAERHGSLRSTVERAQRKRARSWGQMWLGRAQSGGRCGWGEPSPGADVAGAGPVPVQMWVWVGAHCRSRVFIVASGSAGIRTGTLRNSSYLLTRQVRVRVCGGPGQHTPLMTAASAAAAEAASCGRACESAGVLVRRVCTCNSGVQTPRVFRIDRRAGSA
jgi:hypothetical protein